MQCVYHYSSRHLGRAAKTGRRVAVADQAGVELAYSAFPLKCSFAAAFMRVRAFAITG